MALGTAQLGFSYGIVNKAGLPDDAAAQAVFDAAAQGGVMLYDTAAAYGSAEERLGRFLTRQDGDGFIAVTKLSPLPDLADDAAPAAVEDAVRSSVRQSCERLGRARLDYLLLHRWEHWRSHGGRIRATLLTLQSEGVIERLGASVYLPEQALEALQETAIEFIQFPFNLLDWRWKKTGLHEARASRPDVILQARSIYLQGLLLHRPGDFIAIPGYDLARLPERLDRFVAQFGRAGRADLACAYVRAQRWIDTLVVGAETPDQIRESAALFSSPPLTPDQGQALEEAFADAPELLIDSSKLWKSS